ncbi:814_t:CDS:2, partial [Rhizophagus irregularis]
MPEKGLQKYFIKLKYRGIELDILIENVDKEQEQVGKPYQMRDRLKISIFRNLSMNCATSCSVGVEKKSIWSIGHACIVT